MHSLAFSRKLPLMVEAALYRHFAGDAFFNMAVDEWLVRKVSAMPRAVLLRLYTWREGAITIGLHQKAEAALDWVQVGATPVIRRVTGGRAVYHDPSELTYSLAVNTESVAAVALRGSLHETSQRIGEALTRFLRSLGLDAVAVRRGTPRELRPAVLHATPCFDSVSRYEVVTEAGKIVASAQRRFGPILLQHGSIKLHGAVEHAALPLQRRRNICVPQAAAITRPQFERLVEEFASEISGFLRVDAEPVAIKNAEAVEVESAAMKLKKNPLRRRDIFERAVRTGSLWSGCRREKTA